MSEFIWGFIAGTFLWFVSVTLFFARVINHLERKDIQIDRLRQTIEYREATIRELRGE